MALPFHFEAFPVHGPLVGTGRLLAGTGDRNEGVLVPRWLPSLLLLQVLQGVPQIKTTRILRDALLRHEGYL